MLSKTPSLCFHLKTFVYHLAVLGRHSLSRWTLLLLLQVRVSAADYPLYHLTFFYCT
nr:MAG TPA: hypothetical protein [Caudoviricetes sp.]